MLLREYIGFDPRNPYGAKYSNINYHITESAPAVFGQSGDNSQVPTVKIAAIHLFPYVTRNFTRYHLEGAQKSIGKWTYPYNIPTIMFHNDIDGQVNGRIISASIQDSNETNSPYIEVQATTPLQSTQDSLQQDLLKTVSIGVDCFDVRCSICGAQLTEEWCEHIPGQIYDGKTCINEVYEYAPRELSYVIVPADEYARVLPESSKASQPYPGLFVPAVTSPIPMLNSSKSASNNKTGSNLILTNSIKETFTTMDFKDSPEYKTMQSTIDALTLDKKQLSEQLESANTDKIALHESINKIQGENTNLAAKLAAQKAEYEAQATKLEEMSKEVKSTLAMSYAALREKAGLSAMENLEKRSMDSLRDSINDLKAMLATESINKTANIVKTAEQSIPAKTEAKFNDDKENGTVKVLSL